MIHNHNHRLWERYVQSYKIVLGIQETNNVCLYAGVLVTSDTIVLWVITFPACTEGAPYVHLVLLLGVGDSGGLDTTVESIGMGD